MKDIVLLTMLNKNCGDYLIAERAKALFKKYLPSAMLQEINRLHKYSDSAIDNMRNADCVVIVGGPVIRENAAEILNLDQLAVSGELLAMKTPFVIFGGGAKPLAPFEASAINMTTATRLLFDKLSISKYYSSTRDFESIALLRNAGYNCFCFSGCPALYANGGENENYILNELRTIVFSCGAPGLMTSDSVNQHLSVARMIKSKFPTAKIFAAFHHPINLQGLPNNTSSEWMELPERLRKMGLTPIDISGGTDKMKSLYQEADLHVGYRVHAHILMTSWKKASILIAEDGRGSAMADIISGKTFKAYKNIRYRTIPLRPKWCPPKFWRTSCQYQMNISDEISTYIDKNIVVGKEVPNQPKPGVFGGPMKAWFEQFV